MGLGIALGAALGAAPGVLAGHVAIWLGDRDRDWNGHRRNLPARRKTMRPSALRCTGHMK